MGFITTRIRQLTDDPVEHLQILRTEAEPIHQIEDERDAAANGMTEDKDSIHVFLLSGKSRGAHPSALLSFANFSL